MTDGLKSLLRTFAKFDDTEIDRISKAFHVKTAKKNSILLSAGSVAKEFSYVQTGGLRTFFVEKNGHEKTRYIILDNGIGTTLTSFVTQTPSFEFIEALDDTEFSSISHQDFYRFNDEMNNWKIFYQKILERAYAFQNRKIESLVTLTAKQRYEQLLKENPRFVQRLSNKVLASYLDVREETLSRLKSP